MLAALNMGIIGTIIVIASRRGRRALPDATGLRTPGDAQVPSARGSGRDLWGTIGSRRRGRPKAAAAVADASRGTAAEGRVTEGSSPGGTSVAAPVSPFTPRLSALQQLLGAEPG